MKVLRLHLAIIVTVSNGSYVHASNSNLALALSQRTIAGKISVKSDLTTFYKALQIGGLVELFDCPEFCEHYTIFCPKDEAFAQFQHLHWFDSDDGGQRYAYSEHLKQLMQYHVLPGRIYEDDFVDAKRYETMQGQIVVATVEESSSGTDLVVTLNDDNAVVFGYNKWARNGLIQGVSQVLLPLFAEETVANVVARVAPKFWNALILTGVDYLLMAGPLTILAPSDHSFGDSMVRNDNESLTELVKYHIIPNQVVIDEEFEDGDAYVTLLGTTLTLGDSANRTGTNILGSNGIVHVIDRILEPPSNLWSLIADIPELKSFRGAMITAGLNASLQAAGPMTLFAPSNKAMEYFRVRKGNQSDKRDLLYYIIGGRRYRKDLSDRLFKTASQDNVLVDVRFDGDVFLNGNAKVSSFNREASNGILHIISERLHRPTDIIATATSCGLTSFVNAVALAGLTETFRGRGPYTIFAWTNNAWGRLDDKISDKLLNDPDRLRKLVLYHILPEYLLFDDLRVGGNYTTLLKRDLEVSFDHLDGYKSSSSCRVQVNDAYVSGFDLMASNGCLHRISKVLQIPSF